MQRSALPILAALLALSFGARPACAAAGSLDTTFGSGGATITTLTTASDINGVFPASVRLQSDGKILALTNVSNGPGTTTDVLRYTTAGVLDTTFGSKGIAALPTTLGNESMTIQSNGQIVVAGVSTSGYTVERLNSNGSMDTTFGSDGVASASLGGRAAGSGLVVLVETNGDILVVGQLLPAGRRQPAQTMLARFTSAGSGPQFWHERHDYRNRQRRLLCSGRDFYRRNPGC